jgi:hypothetical protein
MNPINLISKSYLPLMYAAYSDIVGFGMLSTKIFQLILEIQSPLKKHLVLLYLRSNFVRPASSSYSLLPCFHFQN